MFRLDDATYMPYLNFLYVCVCVCVVPFGIDGSFVHHSSRETKKTFSIVICLCLGHGADLTANIHVGLVTEAWKTFNQRT